MNKNQESAARDYEDYLTMLHIILLATDLFEFINDGYHKIRCMIIGRGWACA